MILAVLFTKLEINRKICLGSGLSVESKREDKMCHPVFVSFYYFREEVAVW
jgi:hypothetical protein